MIVEDMHDGSAGQPIVEITEHHHQRSADRFEILQDLAHLETPFMDPQAEMGGEHMDDGAADLEGRGQRPACVPSQGFWS